MARKTTILMPVDYYCPAFLAGGPVRTLLGIVERLGGEFDFKIITRNWDFGDSRPFCTTKADQWNWVGNAHVYYLSAATCNRKSLRRLIIDTPHDLLYLNSFWSEQFSVNVLWNRRFKLIPSKPVVLAPRGELSRKALNHKKIKKNIFMQLASFIGLYKGISWHGSSESECAQIRDYLLQFETNPELSTVHAAMDLRPALDFDTTPKPEKQNGSLRLVFLARIHPIKQLNVALEVLKEVRGDVFFGIYGPIDPGEETYWIRCQALIRELPSNIKVEYHGTLDSFKVGAELHKYHAFFMPTLTENYGHSIAEALSAGCPVVISDQTPWRGLSDKGIGWDVPLDRFDLFVKAIQELVDMPAQEYNEMSAGCKKYAEMEANSPETLEAYRLMFRQTAQKCDN